MSELPYVVTDLDDLRRLVGQRCTLNDSAVLWRLLREGRRLVQQDDGTIEVCIASEAELDAWIAKARMAARRERSALADAAGIQRPLSAEIANRAAPTVVPSPAEQP